MTRHAAPMRLTLSLIAGLCGVSAPERGRLMLRNTTLAIAFATALVMLGSLVVTACFGSSPETSTDYQAPPETIRAGHLLDDTRAPQGEAGNFEPPTFAQRRAIDDVLPDFLDELETDSVDIDAYRPRFEAAGLRLDTYDHGDQQWLLLYEAGDRWRGTGAYVFRPGTDASDLVVQAPHSYFDRHTDRIGLAVFEDTNARAFFFNTLHRYHASSTFRATDIALSDPSHNSSSFYHKISTAVLEHRPATAMLELHGFTGTDSGGRAHRFIASEGVDNPGDLSRELTAALRAEYGDDSTALYPEDTRQLGGTGNVLSRWTSRHSPGQFIHLEIDDQTRGELRDEPGPLIRAVSHSLAAKRH